MRSALVATAFVAALAAVPALPQAQVWAEAYGGPAPAGREFALIGEEGYTDGAIGW